jgi:hypothetical protein
MQQQTQPSLDQLSQPNPDHNSLSPIRKHLSRMQIAEYEDIDKMLEDDDFDFENSSPVNRQVLTNVPNQQDLQNAPNQQDLLNVPTLSVPIRAPLRNIPTIQYATHTIQLPEIQVPRKRKWDDMTRSLDSLLQEEKECRARISQCDADIEKGKRARVTKQTEQSILTTIMNEVEKIKLDAKYEILHNRLDGKEGKRQRLGELKEEYGKRVNKPHPNLCDNILKTGFKCQRNKVEVLEGKNWCRPCLTKKLMANYSSTFTIS